MRVLLVEDDPMIGEAIAGTLRDASYAADWVRDGHAALASLVQHAYDVVLLDLGLPGVAGMEVLSKLRQRQDAVPVLIITAREGLEDRVQGLDGGADDFITKPFEMAELLARMRAVIRRKEGRAVPLLGNGTLTLDPVTRRATSGNAPAVMLTAREFALLHALLVRPGAILSRNQLEERIYGWGEAVESNAVEYLIHTLRKKLGNTAIRNVRGLGWMVSASG